MVELFHSKQWLEAAKEERLPAVERDLDLVILIADQLRKIDTCHGALLGHSYHVIKARDRCSAKLLFQKAKTPIWPKLCMSSYHEVQFDVEVKLVDCSPNEVEQHVPVFVLTGAVVTVEMDVVFTEAIVVEEVVQVTDDRITSL